MTEDNNDLEIENKKEVHSKKKTQKEREGKDSTNQHQQFQIKLIKVHMLYV